MGKLGKSTAPTRLLVSNEGGRIVLHEDLLKLLKQRKCSFRNCIILSIVTVGDPKQASALELNDNSFVLASSTKGNLPIDDGRKMVQEPGIYATFIEKLLIKSYPENTSMLVLEYVAESPCDGYLMTLLFMLSSVVVHNQIGNPEVLKPK
jgi:hypothetical protein